MGAERVQMQNSGEAHPRQQWAARCGQQSAAGREGMNKAKAMRYGTELGTAAAPGRSTEGSRYKKPGGSIQRESQRCAGQQGPPRQLGGRWCKGLHSLVITRPTKENPARSIEGDEWRLIGRRARCHRRCSCRRRGRQPGGRARASHRCSRGRQLLLLRRVLLLQAAAEHVKGLKGLCEDGLVAALHTSGARMVAVGKGGGG